jgi:hypothetical protein
MHIFLLLCRAERETDASHSSGIKLELLAAVAASLRPSIPVQPANGTKGIGLQCQG